MSSLGGLLGTAGGAGGTGFAGPAAASISDPTTMAQIDTAYQGNQAGLANQNTLLGQLQGQNGLANQSSVYNQLQGVANGTGPNPAQAMLAQSTGANVANQGALMAGQRGSNANAGLIARQAAQQGAATQQQAAGQAASLQANQSLNAMGQLGNIANTQVSNQIGQVNANTAAQQAEQANLFNAQAGVNSNNVSSQNNINSVNGQLANTQLQGQQALYGGLMNSAGSGLSSLMSMGAQGGKATKQGFQRPMYAMGSDAIQSPDGGSDSLQPQEMAPEQGVAPESSGNDFDTNNATAQVGAPGADSVPSFGSDAGAAGLAQGAGSFGGSGGKSGGGGGGGGMSSMMGLLAMMADGGEVRKMYADPTQPVSATDNAPTEAQPKSKFGQFLKGSTKKQAPGAASEMNWGNPGANQLYKGASALGSSVGSALSSPNPQGQTVAGGPMDTGMPQTPTQPGMDSETMLAAEGGFIHSLCYGDSDKTPMAQGGNAGEQRKKIYGSSSSPAKPEMREKHIKAIKDFAKKLLSIDINPSGGKINAKTGERRDKDAEVGVDKPDWRSGQLESQWNPDAMIHELAHLMLLPVGVGLKQGQTNMDKQYSDVQKKYGYMKQKRSQGEIQPMAVENLIRRHLGLPAATQSTPVKEGEGPRTAVDTGEAAAVRVPKGNKEVDLIRQTRLLSPENHQRIGHIMAGHLKFHPEMGWQVNPNAMGAKTQLYKQEQQNPTPMPEMPMKKAMAKGGAVPALVSPGEQYLPPKDVQKVAKGANPLSVGEKIPGKPKYKGNDYRNDVVPKTLEEGGIVIPNKILQGPNPHWNAMRFVHSTMRKGKK